jgi:intracellular septation protein A
MHDGNITPLADALSGWNNFYSLLGTASATLVGLLFVAATVGASARVYTISRPVAQRVFLSASVVHFSGILAACLIVLVPLQSWISVGVMIMAGGLFGLAYCGLIWRDTVKDGLSKSIELEDKLCYIVLPFAGYLIEVAAGVTFILRSDLGGAALALSSGMLLVIGIRNAWDITIWTITRPRE